jgi:hypothetical protein
VIEPHKPWEDRLGAGPIPDPDELLTEREAFESDSFTVTLPPEKQPRAGEADPFAINELAPDNEMETEQPSQMNGLGPVIWTFSNAIETAAFEIDILGVSDERKLVPVITTGDSLGHGVDPPSQVQSVALICTGPRLTLQDIII